MHWLLMEGLRFTPLELSVAMFTPTQLSPPPILRSELIQLLFACTTKCPFTHIDGSMYLQSDGVTMGSPLGVTFANFYMCHLENSVLDIQPNIKPIVYCRYINEIFLIIKIIDQLTKLKDWFESNSVPTIKLIFLMYM